VKFKFNVIFKKGSKVIAEVKGGEMPEIVTGMLTLQELTEKVIETEQFLEKLTGMRVHIEQVL
jgi:hypothetical protein